jgi:FSR family fosmidomycin resistance protein-like MFS transporter
MAGTIANPRKRLYSNNMSVTTVPLRHDLKVMGLVGVAHGASHFFHLILPPLFPILKAEFGVSYTALALLTTLFYAASGFAQTIAGFMVDHFGARRVLLSGLSVLSISVIGYGFTSEYWMLMVLSVCAGLGNSVFHPADLSILTSKVSAERLGRAYATHGLCGNLGWAVAPVFVGTIALYADWRTAAIAAGMVGLTIVAAFMLWGGALAEVEAEIPAPRPSGRRETITRNLQMLLTPTIISCFLYFAFLAASLIGVQAFGITAIQQLYTIEFATATAALTAFLIGSAAGVFAGGVLADRTDRHDLIAMGGVALAAVVLVSIGAQAISVALVIPALALAGFLSGTTGPSRDMLVRKATPKGATGRIFGFVYSGLDLGSSLMPLLLGWIMDSGRADMVFYGCAAMLVVTMATVTQVRQHDANRPEQA